MHKNYGIPYRKYRAPEILSRSCTMMCAKRTTKTMNLTVNPFKIACFTNKAFMNKFCYALF